MGLSTTWKGRPVALGSPTTLALEGARARCWYAVSGGSVERYAARMGFDRERVADVVAVLSPRVSVAQNARLAREYLETGDIQRGVMRLRVEALRRYELDGVVRGPKVSAFARALKGDSNAVAVDAWMLRIYSLSGRAADLRTAERRIRALASHLGWPPAETQAALWVGARARCGLPDAVSPLLMEEGAP